MESRDEYQLRAAEVNFKQSLQGCRLSPEGRWLSFLLQRDVRVEEINNKKIKEKPLADLVLISSRGGYPLPLTNTGDVDKPGMWSMDGKSLVFGRANKLQIIEFAEAEPGRLTINRIRTLYEGKSNDPKLRAGDAYLSYPSWRPPNNDFILFATCEKEVTILLAVSTNGDIQRKLYSRTGTIIGWNWSPDGRTIVLVTRDEDGMAGNICILDFESGKLISQWEKKEQHYKYQLPIAIWTLSGDQIIFRSNRSKWAKLWIASPDATDAHPLTTGDWDDYAFRLSPDGKQLVYASREKQTSSGDDLWIIPISGGERQRITQHPGVNIPLAWSADNHIFYWHSNPTEPGDLWVVSLGEVEHRSTRLTFSVPAELVRKLRAPEEISIESDDGAIIPALVYLPKYFQDDKKYPAVIWIRGGPTGSCRFDFNPLYNWLANLGFIVVSPNYRGSTGCGVQHMTAVVGEGMGKHDLNDILAVGKYVKEKLQNVDLNRGIGIGGDSWGGYLTLMAITQAPDDFSCAVAGAAISDWSIQQAETEVRSYDYWLVGGWVYEQQERVRERSPVNFIERIRVPLLVHHGEQDRDVPFSQIKDFVKKAQDAGVLIKHKFYPIEEHNYKKNENQEDRLNIVGDFFRKHLQDWNFSDNPCADQVT